MENNSTCCAKCGTLIADWEARYTGDASTDLCCDCGEEDLMFCDDVNGYVHCDDYKDWYRDDELSDIEVFQYEQGGGNEW